MDRCIIDGLSDHEAATVAALLAGNPPISVIVRDRSVG
jgi:hypothetical protein